MARVYRLDIDRAVFDAIQNSKREVVLGILLFETESEVVSALEDPEKFSRATGLHKANDPFGGFVIRPDPADLRTKEEILNDIRREPGLVLRGSQLYHESTCQLTLPIPLPRMSDTSGSNS